MHFWRRKLAIGILLCIILLLLRILFAPAALWRWWFTCSLLLCVERFPSWIMNRCWFLWQPLESIDYLFRFLPFFTFTSPPVNSRAPFWLQVVVVTLAPTSFVVVWWISIQKVALNSALEFPSILCVFVLVAVLYCVLFTALTACSPSDPHAKFVLYPSCSGDAAGVCCGLIDCDMILV